MTILHAKHGPLQKHAHPTYATTHSTTNCVCMQMTELYSYMHTDAKLLFSSLDHSNYVPQTTPGHTTTPGYATRPGPMATPGLGTEPVPTTAPGYAMKPAPTTAPGYRTEPAPTTAPGYETEPRYSTWPAYATSDSQFVDSGDHPVTVVPDQDNRHASH